jgi:hypothetical protein
MVRRSRADPSWRRAGTRSDHQGPRSHRGATHQQRSLPSTPPPGPQPRPISTRSSTVCRPSTSCLNSPSTVASPITTACSVPWTGTGSEVSASPWTTPAPVTPACNTWFVSPRHPQARYRIHPGHRRRPRTPRLSSPSPPRPAQPSSPKASRHPSRSPRCGGSAFPRGRAITLPTPHATTHAPAPQGLMFPPDTLGQRLREERPHFSRGRVSPARHVAPGSDPPTSRCRGPRQRSSATRRRGPWSRVRTRPRRR